jgi:hypothetical protein
VRLLYQKSVKSQDFLATVSRQNRNVTFLAK